MVLFTVLASDVSCEFDIFSVSPPILADRDRDMRRLRVIEYVREPEDSFIFNYEQVVKTEDDLVFPMYDF